MQVTGNNASNEASRLKREIEEKAESQKSKVQNQLQTVGSEYVLCSFRFLTQLKCHFAGYLLRAVMGMCQ